MKQQLKLYKVTIYGPNPTTMNHIAKVQVIMLDVNGLSVAINAKREMGYSSVAKTEVEELAGPYGAGYLISYRELTDEPLPVRPETDLVPMNEFDALFED